MSTGPVRQASVLSLPLFLSVLMSPLPGLGEDGLCGRILAALLKPKPIAKPVSVVFIIDNSGSMDENDPGAARFGFTASLMDSLAAHSPESEAGLVVFTRRLSFDHRENPFFK